MWVPGVPLSGLGSTVREEPPAKSSAEEVRSGACVSQVANMPRDAQCGSMSQVAKGGVDSPQAPQAAGSAGDI